MNLFSKTPDDWRDASLKTHCHYQLADVQRFCHLFTFAEGSSLRSADVPTCVVQRTYSSYGDITVAAAGPRWNSLPVQLRNSDISYGRFRWQLKGHLFGNDEHGALWPSICSAIEKRFTYLLTCWLWSHPSFSACRWPEMDETYLWRRSIQSAIKLIWSL